MALIARRIIKATSTRGVEKHSVTDSKKVVETARSTAKSMITLFVAVSRDARLAFVGVLLYGYLISILSWPLSKHLHGMQAAHGTTPRNVEVDNKQKGTPLHRRNRRRDTAAILSGTSSVALPSSVHELFGFRRRTRRA